ncbi:hypothetical protein KQX54_014749 [Cotesia glomerata]|uniref:Homeobox domain-containing protein n=1 Tax=Cotesia glomerata TaxID=32391 RepID=A0AAV7IQT6_COTGL|nr:hypothetical protein KQX54_014749 [Cotesia glomerata]
MEHQRLKLTEDQLLNLEGTFRMNQYPSAFIREQIAKSLGITEMQVTNWFGNRRFKERRKYSRQNINQNQNCQVKEQKEHWHQNVNQDQYRHVKERKEDWYQYFNQDQYRQVEERIEDWYQNVNQDHNRQVKESKEDSYQNVNPNLERRCYSQAELNDIIDRLLCTTDNSENCSSYQNFLKETFQINPFMSALARKKIGESVGLTEKQVGDWFNNRRRNERKKNSRQNINQDQNRQVEEKKENVNQDQNRQVEERKEDSYQNVNPNLEESVYHQAEPSDIINRFTTDNSVNRSSYQNYWSYFYVSFYLNMMLYYRTHANQENCNFYLNEFYRNKLIMPQL